MNNKEWLYSLDPHALTEWFESEHTSNDTLGAKKVVSVHTGTANDANVSTHVETANGTLDGETDVLRVQVDSLRSDLHAARSDAEYYRGKLGSVLDCVCDALRVGTLDVSVVDMKGEVVS